MHFGMDVKAGALRSFQPEDRLDLVDGFND